MKETRESKSVALRVYVMLKLLPLFPAVIDICSVLVNKSRNRFTMQM